MQSQPTASVKVENVFKGDWFSTNGQDWYQALEEPVIMKKGKVDLVRIKSRQFLTSRTAFFMRPMGDLIQVKVKTR